MSNEEILQELKYIAGRVQVLIDEIEDSNSRENWTKFLAGSDNEWMIPYLVKFEIYEPRANMEKMRRICNKSCWIYDNLIKIRIDTSASNWLVCPLPNDNISGLSNQRAFNDRCVEGYFEYLVGKDPNFAKYVSDKILYIANNKPLYKRYGITAADFEDFNLDLYPYLKRILLMEFEAKQYD